MQKLMNFIKQETLYKNILIFQTVLIFFLTIIFSFILNSMNSWVVVPKFSLKTIIPVLQSTIEFRSLLDKFWNDAPALYNFLFILIILLFGLLLISMIIVFVSLVMKKQAMNILLFLLMIYLGSILSTSSLYLYLEPNFQELLYRFGAMFFKDNYIYLFIYFFLFSFCIFFINLFFVVLSLFVVNSKLTSERKLIYQIVIVLFFISSSAFYLLLPQLTKQFTDIKYIKGLNLVDIPKDKCYTGFDHNGKEIKNCLKGYYLYKSKSEEKKSIKIPLIKQNYTLLNQYDEFLGVDSYQSFLFYYFNYNISEAELESVKTIRSNGRNTITCLIILVEFIKNGKNNIGKESLKTLESTFNNKDIHVNDEINCFKSLLKYKQNQYTQAQKLSITSNNKFCLLTRNLLKGKIKKTVFKGSISFKSNPIFKVPVMISVSNPQNTNKPLYYLVDIALTDKKGNFSLTSETDKALTLTIFDNKVKKIIFDYKKLGLNNKGGIVDLGKIELE